MSNKPLMPPPTRRVAGAQQLAAAADKTVTVVVDGDMLTYPDVTERYLNWQRYVGKSARPYGRFMADRIAAQQLRAYPGQEATHLWVSMDDRPVVYLVQYVRKTGRVPLADIVGATRTGKSVPDQDGGADPKPDG